MICAWLLFVLLSLTNTHSSYSARNCHTDTFRLVTHYATLLPPPLAHALNHPNTRSPHKVTERYTYYDRTNNENLQPQDVIHDVRHNGEHPHQYSTQCVVNIRITLTGLPLRHVQTSNTYGERRTTPITTTTKTTATAICDLRQLVCHTDTFRLVTYYGTLLPPSPRSRTESPQHLVTTQSDTTLFIL